MRLLAVAAGTCAAAYLLRKIVRNRGGNTVVAVPELGLSILPESIESMDAKQKPEKSPLRAFGENIVTRRIMGAVPFYLGVAFLQMGVAKGPTPISYACGLIVSFGFPAMLWPTDKGVRSRSWFRAMTPLSIFRALMFNRHVYYEWIYVHELNIPRTTISYLHAAYCIFMPWTQVVLNVRVRAVDLAALPVTIPRSVVLPRSPTHASCALYS